MLVKIVTKNQVEVCVYECARFTLRRSESRIWFESNDNTNVEVELGPGTNLYIMNDTGQTVDSYFINDPSQEN
jgi:hypothetical protein